MPVAVKMLPPVSSSVMSNVEKELETLALATVHCSHSCRLIGTCAITPPGARAGGPSDAVALVMKKYECSLHDVLGLEPQRVMDPRVAMGVGARIARAIDELHELKIILRDLKPSNILFDKYGDLVVSDFGISVQLETSITHVAPTSVQGTLAYMAPEALDPEMYGGLGMPSDLWALGCCLVEMLSGQPPFSGVPYHQILRRVCDRKEAPSVPPGLLPPEAEQLVKRCFSFNPKERPTAIDTHILLQEIAQAPTAGAASSVPSVVTESMGSSVPSFGGYLQPAHFDVQQAAGDPTLEHLTMRIARLRRYDR